MSLRCPIAPCEFEDPFVNELGAHLIAAHGYERADAVLAAKKVQSLADPLGLDANGIKKAETPPSVTPAVTPPTPEEPTMPRTTKRVDPANCKLCQRLGAPCKRHGGAGRRRAVHVEWRQGPEGGRRIEAEARRA